MGRKRIAILHTTPATIEPLGRLCGEKIPGAEVKNFLDDTILPEISLAGRITEGARYRLYAMMQMAQTAGADVLLCACSSVGETVEEGRELVRLPVLRIDEAMAEQAVERGSRIGIAAALETTLGPTARLVERKAAERGKKVVWEYRLARGAQELLSQGKLEEYDRMVVESLMGLESSCDIVLLAQASMARVLPLLPKEKRKKFLTSPESGIERLARVLSI